MKNNCGPPIKRMNCWSSLKGHSKFDLFLNPPMSAQTSSEQDREDISDNEKANVVKNKEFKRLIGRERTKVMKAIFE